MSGSSKRFVRHDMAPVAGGITDAEEDRFILGFGKRQRLRAPFPPVDGIVGVLQEIGGCGLIESIGHVVSGVNWIIVLALLR